MTSTLTIPTLTTLTRTVGTVKWFNDRGGYGLITRDDGESDCFVQRSAISGESFDTLASGDRVQFDIVEGRERASAANVTKLVCYIH